MQEKIDTELLKAIINSPFNEIDYEYLLVHHPAKIREEEMNVMTKEESLPVPPSLSVENIHIPSSEPQRDIRLRVYRPKGKKNLPVLLYFHGGAFIYGTPEQYDFIFFRLALDIDAVIVSVDYRLAPEHPFPAAMEDSYDALLWLSEYADHIGGNKNRIMIGGSSAGATIAASLTHYARDKKEISIQHQYLLYPPTDHLLETSSMNELANAPMQTKKAAEWMWTHYLQHQMIQPPQYSVPLQEKDFKNLPEATIIVCELDPLKDEGKKYAKKLQNAGVSVTLLEIEGAVHAFDFFPCQLSETFYQQQVKLFNPILTQKS
ncbi:MAG: alpha/beta hydrolase [Chryseobacterium jejuense]|uniref:alpha/beta hydrolase n=1 Tax=Chryseobacterium jejuense TaxID=445960 RepID=UPI003D119D36